MIDTTNTTAPTDTVAVSKEDLLDHIKDYLEAAESVVVTDVKAVGTEAKSLFVNDVEPAVVNSFSTAMQIVQRNGGTLLMDAAMDAVGLLTGSPWAVVVAQVVTQAKQLGAQTIAAEEQLAASTALQIQQTIKGTVTAPAAPAA